MTNPKLRPCPRCHSEDVFVFKYDSGVSRVECENCYYIAMPQGTKRQAIQSHNAEFDKVESHDA